nr:recombinase family protein [uncultured Blautia sp.]
MKNQILNKIYRAVVYLRLSDEDGDNRESDSISNQRILIHSFLKNHPEIQVVKECVDDGYTGTNFNRPGFQEMLRMLEQGEADCIIVKDDCVIIEPTQKDLENQGFVAGSICF